MSLPDLDWAFDYERGYRVGMNTILIEFEKELYVATKEDPQYAAYVEDAIQLIKKIIKDKTGE